MNQTYQIMNHIQREPGMTREKWDAELSRELVTGFRRGLTNRDLRRFDSLLAKQQTALTTEDHALSEKLDDYILEQTATVGWRIVFSTLVNVRMKHWEEACLSHRFIQLGKAAQVAAEIHAGKRLAPLNDPDWYPYKKEMKEELDRLFRAVKSEIAARHDRRIDDREVLKIISQRVEDNRGGLPHLYRQRAFLMDYLRAQFSDVKPMIFNTRIKAATIFDNWYASQLRRDPEKFGQAISKIGNRPQHPSS